MQRECDRREKGKGSKMKSRKISRLSYFVGRAHRQKEWTSAIFKTIITTPYFYL